MILQKLIEYFNRDDIFAKMPPKMYDRTPIRWIIDLDENGRFIPHLVDTADEENKRGKRFETPHILKSSGIVSKLLAENGEYVLGIARDPKKQKRVDRCHELFVNLIETCAEKTGEPTVKAVSEFLKENPKDKMDIPNDFDSGDMITFRVSGVMPIDLPAVRDYWAEYTKQKGEKMQCLLCGKFLPPAERLPFKVKGIPGGQTSGMAVISANASAFESYGLEASLIAPTCADCGEKFSKALNDLLSTEGCNLAVGALKYVFWTKEETSFSVVSFLDAPDPAEVKALISSVFSGKTGYSGLDISPFYAAALTSSGGRVVFRDWIDTTVGSVKRNLARFFQLMKIADPNEEYPRPTGIYRLSSSTVLDARKNLPSQVPKSLISFALKGGRLPFWLLNLSINRNRAEHRVPRNRASLIKLVYLSNLKQIPKENYMVNLETKNREPAYMCGRLLAVLESIQYGALGKVGANVVDRFYGTASSAPASVFGNLMKGAQAHLSKIRKEKPGLEIKRQKELQSVLENIQEFPKTLGMQGQALFALGYYHQRAAHFEKEEESTETKNDNN